MGNSRPFLLVIDDDREITTIVGAIAERAGFDVAVANGPDAMNAALKSHDPEVIVVDLQMPDMDGIQTLRLLSDKAVHAEILIVSGMDQRTIAAAEQYARNKGLRLLGSLQKPFMPEDLFERLEGVISAAGPLSEMDLKTAIEQEQLAIHYQPTVRRFADGTWDIESFEALLRWNHPSRGMLTPDEFLEMGEKSGAIAVMTDYVIEKGVQQLKGWHASRLNLGLRINIAATLLDEIEFPDRLQALIEEQEVDPSALTLEISETAMLDQDSDTFDILTRLRVKDINLAIDDFGIGYSSLTQLFRMPFNEMKIDKSLLLRVSESREARIMMETLVDLAHKLNLTACAVGVETEEALSFIDSLGCDSAQGFLIGRPTAPKDVPKVIDRWDRRRHQQREERAMEIPSR